MFCMRELNHLQFLHNYKNNDCKTIPETVKLMLINSPQSWFAH